MNDEAIGLIQNLALKRGEEEKLRARMENLRGRIDRAHEDNVRYADIVTQMEDRVQRMTMDDRELRRRFVEAEMRLYQEESRKKLLKEEADALHHRSLAVRMEIERKVAKRDFLRGLVESGEGASEGTRFLMGQETWKQRHFVTVGDIVTADEKYRVAIETALGEAANLVVAERPEDAHVALAELRRHGKGKAAFVVLSRIPRVRRIKFPLGLQTASALAQTKPQYRALVDFLLGDIIVCENFDQATQAVHTVAGARCVTLDGQVVTSAGVLRGGSMRQDEGGYLGRQKQIAELEGEIDRLKQDLTSITAEEVEKTRHYEAIDLKPFREEVKSIEKEMTALEISIAQIEFEKKRANEEIERNNKQSELLHAEIEEIQSILISLTNEVANLERTKAEMERRLSAASAEVESMEREWNAQSKVVTELEVQVATRQGELRNIEREIELTQTSLKETTELIARRDQEIAEAGRDIARLTSELSTHDAERTALREATRRVELRKQEIERRYNQQREHIHRVELKIKDDRQLHDEAVEEVHELDLKVNEVKSNIEHLKERARKEFEMELELKTYPGDEWVDFAARREDVRQLKEKIRALGAINFAAFDEFKTEGERLQFLVQQRDDLLEAERTLLSTIEEINTTAQKKFLDTFSQIRENFITTFRELFDPGDECDLRLGEGLDPLEAPIEIIAKPRGKRPTSIELLSGGEKTLTAIALLFAIYLVKPSPFCILDEVDAPLDDSNIDRYTRILHKFSDNTQFIVVTHNKRTMEAANALYGVTMEEEGVSKIVTVRFTEGARVESAALASGL